MTIYIDVVFAINFLMDTTIIWAAGMLNKEKIRIGNLIIGGILGAALYIVSLYFLYSNTMLQMPAALTSMCLSLIIAYKPKTVLHTIKLMLISIAVSFIAAGMIFGFLCFRAVISKEGFSYIMESFSIWVLVISAALVYAVIKIAGGYIRKGISDKREYYDLEVTIEGNKFSARALADSGNSLKDDIGNNQIIICEYDVAKKILPDMEISSDSVMMFNQLSLTNFNTRIRLIPFKSIGEKNGLLLGIKCDEVEIRGKRSITCKNAIICLFNGSLDGRGLFNAIINYDVFL